MSENDWDDIPKEELLKVAPALIYLKRTFGTEVGNPSVKKVEDGKTENTNRTPPRD